MAVRAEKAQGFVLQNLEGSEFILLGDMVFPYKESKKGIFFSPVASHCVFPLILTKESWAVLTSENCGGQQKGLVASTKMTQLNKAPGERRGHEVQRAGKACFCKAVQRNIESKEMASKQRTGEKPRGQSQPESWCNAESSHSCCGEAARVLRISLCNLQGLDSWNF